MVGIRVYPHKNTPLHKNTPPCFRRFGNKGGYSYTGEILHWPRSGKFWGFFIENPLEIVFLSVKTMKKCSKFSRAARGYQIT